MHFCMNDFYPYSRYTAFNAIRSPLDQVYGFSIANLNNAWFPIQISSVPAPAVPDIHDI